MCEAGYVGSRSGFYGARFRFGSDDKYEIRYLRAIILNNASGLVLRRPSMSETVTTLPPKKYIFYNRCGNDTNHTCEAEHHREYMINERDGLESEVITLGHRLWICAGCERETLEEYHFFSGEDQDVVSSYYPERTKMHVNGKSWL